MLPRGVRRPKRTISTRARKLLAVVAMTAVGFEPTHPKIVELESTALDHSATLS